MLPVTPCSNVPVLDNGWSCGLRYGSTTLIVYCPGSRFVMETDFLDDPSRPGAVMAITTVPKRTKTFIEKGLMTEEQAWTIHHDNPRTIYGSAFDG